MIYIYQGRIQDFKLGGGAHLKKLRRAKGGAKIFGVFRVKNHDFTPKNHIFSNFRGEGRPLDPPLYIVHCLLLKSLMRPIMIVTITTTTSYYKLCSA